MFITLIRCPVCCAVMDVIRHPEKELDGYATALISGTCRKEHARVSPKCPENDAWIRGWDKDFRGEEPDDDIRLTFESMPKVTRHNDSPVELKFFRLVDRLCFEARGMKYELEELRKLKAATSWLPMHACVTGDCPHNNVNECLKALIKEIQSWEEE